MKKTWEELVWEEIFVENGVNRVFIYIIIKIM